MARVNVASGLIPNNPLTVAADTQGKVKCVTIQNVSAVDVYVSEDPNLLQQTSATNLPQVGWHLPPDVAGITPFVLILPRANCKLYARSQGAGAQLETIMVDIFSDRDLQRECAG
jgi:hypothetical protein